MTTGTHLRVVEDLGADGTPAARSSVAQVEALARQVDELAATVEQYRAGLATVAAWLGDAHLQLDELAAHLRADERTN